MFVSLQDASVCNPKYQELDVEVNHGLCGLTGSHPSPVHHAENHLRG